MRGIPLSGTSADRTRVGPETWYRRSGHAAPVGGARRTGIGLRAVQQLTALHPGPWEVAFQDVNTAAVQFWRRVAAQTAGNAWTEERREVPGRPDLPPDVWISFGSPAETYG